MIIGSSPDDYLSMSQKFRTSNSVPKKATNESVMKLMHSDASNSKKKKGKTSKSQMVDGINSLDESNESNLKNYPLINKSTEQVMNEFNNRILELELENTKLKYTYNNIIKDLQIKLNYTKQRLQLLENQCEIYEVFEACNKEIRYYEKQVEALRDSLIKLHTAHETAYSFLIRSNNASKREKLLLNELRTLQKNQAQLLIELKTKDMDILSFKAKEKIWIIEHKELENAQKGFTMCKKRLVRTENEIQATGAAKETSERTITYLKGQNDSLEFKNKEHEKLIIILQKQIERLKIKLREEKIAEHLNDCSITYNDKPTIGASKKKGKSQDHYKLMTDKGHLSELHSQVMKCKEQIKSDLNSIQSEAKAYNCANLNLTVISLKQATSLLLDIVSKFELKELKGLNNIPQLKLKSFKA